MNYKTSKGLKFTEQDVYSEGCLPSTTQCHDVDVTFQSDTLKGIVEEVRAFFDVPRDYLELDACDETGRIDVAVMETDESIQANEHDIALWKQGKKRLWNSIYTFHVSLQTTVSVKC